MSAEQWHAVAIMLAYAGGLSGAAALLAVLEVRWLDREKRRG